MSHPSDIYFYIFNFVFKTIKLPFAIIHLTLSLMTGIAMVFFDKSFKKKITKFKEDIKQNGFYDKNEMLDVSEEEIREGGFALCLQKIYIHTYHPYIISLMVWSVFIYKFFYTN